MTSAVHAQTLNASELSRICRALAAFMPALVIGYSALVDPLINFDLAQGFQFGGVQVADTGKSRLVTKLIMPVFLGLALLTASLAKPVVPQGLRGVALPSVLLLVLACVSALWAKSPGDTLTLAAYQAVLYGSLLIFVAVANDPARVLRYVLLLFAVVVAANLVIVLLRPPGPDGHAGIYAHKNTLGAAGTCAMLFGVFGLYEGRLLSRAIAWFTAVGAAVLILASDSKTALALAVAAPLMAATIFWTSQLLALRPLLTTALILMLGVTGCIMLSLMIGFDTDDILLKTYGDTTFTGRTEIWAFMSSHIEKAPLLGNGFRGFWSLGAASPKHGSEIEFIRTIGSGHNGYLDMTLDLGLVGLGLLVLSLIAALSAAVKFQLRPISRSLLFLSVIIFALGRNMMESVILWSTFFDNLTFLLVGFLACFPERAVSTVQGAAARAPVYPVR